MPRVSTPRTEVIAELGEQLRFTSRRVLLRHLDRIDELAAQVDPEGVYPEDFVVFRVTGYRPELAKPRMVPGAELRGDLSALAERLSESAGLTEGDLTGPVETVASLTERWGISRRTLERYRRLGLIARRVDLGLGRRALVFSGSAVERFEAIHRDRIARAGGFTRLDEAEAERMWHAAVRYRRRLGWSLNRVAIRVAQRSGRSVEGVRRLLRRLDQERGAGDRVFPEPGPPTDRDRMLAVRAWRRGIEPSVIARRSDRQKSSVLRALHDGRADLLRSLELPDEPGRAMPESEPVRIGLRVEPTVDLGVLLERMRRRAPAVVFEERTRAEGYRALLARAGALTRALPASGTTGIELDEIETMLRWASMLKACLIVGQLRLAIDTLEARIGGPVESLGPSRASVLVLESIRAVSGGIDRFDPGRGGRAAAPVSLVLQRWVTRVPDVAAAVEPGRATRLVPQGSHLTDWTRSVAPWQRWLEPDPRLGQVLDRFDPEDAGLLSDRYGLAGTPPRTLASIADERGLGVVHLARRERRLVREAIRLARSRASGE